MRIWGIFLLFFNVFIHGYECGSKLGDVEGFTIVGRVGADSRVCTLRGCATGYTLVAGAGVMVVFGGRRSLF